MGGSLWVAGSPDLWVACSHDLWVACSHDAQRRVSMSVAEKTCPPAASPREGMPPKRLRDHALACHSERSARFPGGFTLVEMLLTMSLLVVLAALAWPSLTRPMANQRLRKAADQVRADLTRARVKAMSSGRPYAFSFLPDADRYSVKAVASGDAMADDTSMGGGDFDSGTAGQGGSASERPLPEGVTFLGGTADVDDPSTLSTGAGGLGDPSDATFAADVTVGEVRFYPDGTASPARVRLKNEYGRSIELRVRGLTGTVSVGEPTSTEQSQMPLEEAPQP